jgi:general secretion pathway protein H
VSRPRAGFTLMELVVVLALIAVAAALVAPAVGRTAEDVMARAEVASVAAVLRGAREQAVTRQEIVEVSLDRDARSLLLRRAGRDGLDAPPARRAFAALLRVDSAATPSAITFLPQGMSSGGRLTVETAGPRRYVVTVDPLSGRVTTQRAAR